MALRFTDPPQNKAVMGRWSYDWIAVAGELRTKPGEWALLEEGGRLSVSTAIRQGSIKDFHPKDGYEVSVRNSNRKVTPATCDIYVRYNPEKKEK